jgi:hypothetical protein
VFFFQLSEHGGAQNRVHVEAVAKDLQEQVEDLHSQIAYELETLDEMRKYQRENCVPSSVCQHFEQCLKETEVNYTLYWYKTMIFGTRCLFDIKEIIFSFLRLTYKKC